MALNWYIRVWYEENNFVSTIKANSMPLFQKRSTCISAIIRTNLFVKRKKLNKIHHRWANISMSYTTCTKKRWKKVTEAKVLKHSKIGQPFSQNEIIFFFCQLFICLFENISTLKKLLSIKIKTKTKNKYQNGYLIDSPPSNRHQTEYSKFHFTFFFF